MLCLEEDKMHVLDKFHSSLSYRTVGLESNVNESTTWHIQDKEEKIHWFIHEAAPESAKVTPILLSYGKNRKMAKFVNLWDDDIKKKKCSGHHCREAESQSNLQPRTQNQENVNLSWPALYYKAMLNIITYKKYI